jgi:Na+-transporting methylmalonyl-CoA/oxaloacetate decarboxylase gamma subunit
MAFVDHRRRGPGRFLDWKIRLIAVGAVLLLVGMAREMDLLVLLSLVFLCGAFVLRFFEKDDAPADDPGDEDEAIDEPAEERDAG